MDSHTYMGGWVGGCRMQGPMYVCHNIHANVSKEGGSRGRGKVQGNRRTPSPQRARSRLALCVALVSLVRSVLHLV